MVVGTEGYKVYRWDSPIHRTLVADGIETSYNESGLSDGITYHYQVSAYNEHGEGPLSLNITVVSNTLPGAPLNLTGSIVNGEASLQWEAPLSDGGAVIDHYEIFRNGVMVMQVTGLTANISDLSVGVTYTFTIKAHNVNGAGPESDTIVLIERTVPNAPVLTADWGDESVGLTWTTPFNGGAIITQYVLYKQLPGYSEWSELARTQANSYTDLAVENGQTYAYQVRAVNSVGEGNLSNEVRDAPRSVPSAPELYILNPGDTILFAAWTAPDDDGGSPVDHFSVYVDGVLFANTTEYNITIDGLANGITYSVTVRAHNSVGTGPVSEPMNAKPIAIPGAPTDLIAIVGPNTVALDWGAPSETGGVFPLQYRVYERMEGASVFTSIGTTMQTSFVVTMGLGDLDIDFDYRVEAFNALGVGGNATVLDVSPSVIYIAGKVVDQDGNALAQVAVHIQGGGQALSDQEGSFIIQTQPGTVILWINGTGFESDSIQVQVGSTPVQLGTIPLEPVHTNDSNAGIDPLLLVLPVVLVLALVGAFLVLRRRR
jgi:fibronectin type 3 domain-containing protein